MINKAQILVLVQFALFGVIGIMALLLPVNSSSVANVIGLIVAAVGPLFALLAIREHGIRNATMPNVVPTPKANVSLIDSGPYRHIRHPIYTGVLFTAFGAAIAHGHIALLIAAMVLTLFFTVKSRYEEEMLHGIYPTYAAYVQRTGRFLPKLR